MIQSEAKPIAPQSHNARYAKLRRQVGKVKFIVEKALHIASWHLRAFTRLEVVIDKIVSCEKVIQIFRKALVGICSNAQYIGVATSAMCSQPCFAEVWSNVRQEDITLLISGNIPRRRRR